MGLYLDHGCDVELVAAFADMSDIRKDLTLFLKF